MRRQRQGVRGHPHPAPCRLDRTDRRRQRQGHGRRRPGRSSAPVFLSSAEALQILSRRPEVPCTLGSSMLQCAAYKGPFQRLAGRWRDLRLHPFRPAGAPTAAAARRRNGHVAQRSRTATTAEGYDSRTHHTRSGQRPGRRRRHPQRHLLPARSDHALPGGGQLQRAAVRYPGIPARLPRLVRGTGCPPGLAPPVRRPARRPPHRLHPPVHQRRAPRHRAALRLGVPGRQRHPPGPDHRAHPRLLPGARLRPGQRDRTRRPPRPGTRFSRGPDRRRPGRDRGGLRPTGGCQRRRVVGFRRRAGG